jgi:hypothetical protein
VEGFASFHFQHVCSPRIQAEKHVVAFAYFLVRHWFSPSEMKCALCHLSFESLQRSVMLL